MLGCPSDGERAAVQQHQHHRLAEGHHGLEQLLLPPRQVQGRVRGLLTAHIFGLAERHDHQVRQAGSGERLLESRLRLVGRLCGFVVFR
jgi:hypothetical protein